MEIDKEFEAAVNQRRERIDSGEEAISDKMRQYLSECELYGDAGPGMHPQCWRPEIEAALAQEYLALYEMLETPQGVALQEKEARQRQEMLDRHYGKAA